MLKILQARLQRYMTVNFQMFKLDLEKAEEQEIKLSTNVGSEKEKEFQKNITFCFTDCAKVLTVWITTNCGEFLKRWEYQTPLPASWETCMQVMKQQLEPDLKQRTGSKLGKEYVKAMYCYPAYITYMQSTSCEIAGLDETQAGSRLLGEISITSDILMTPPYLWQKAKKN